MRKWIGRTLLVSLFALWIVGERGKLIRPSTRRWLRELGGWRKIFTLKFWHAYWYARWTNQYIGYGVHLVFPFTKPKPNNKQWAEVYHGKVLPTELAQALISIKEPIPHQDLEQIIPYATARDIVLEADPEIAVYECGCRSTRADPCQPTQVCMVVGQPFVDFVLEHNPETSRRVTQAEALKLLQEEHARGHMHAAYFKDVMFNRFYAICNCCGCCCAGIEAMKRGVPMVTSSGYVAQVDASRCEGCRTCEHACPFDAIQVNGSASINWEKCMGCGVCEGQCPNHVISLARDERKGLPLDVHHLKALN